MKRQPGRSAAFSAAGRILSRPSMRPVTRAFSNLHTTMYRLTRGMAQSRKYPTMLLTVTGCRSGKPRTVPLIYIKDGERFVIAAAYAGSAADPAWWLNLRENPHAVAQVNNHTFAVNAELAPVEQRPDLWRRLVEMYPYFIEYQQRTSREIPVVILTPAAKPEAPETTPRPWRTSQSAKTRETSTSELPSAVHSGGGSEYLSSGPIDAGIRPRRPARLRRRGWGP